VVDGVLLVGVHSSIALTFLETWQAEQVGAGNTRRLVAMGDGGVTDAFGRLESLEQMIYNPFTGLRLAPIGFQLPGLPLGLFGRLAMGGVGFRLGFSLGSAVSGEPAGLPVSLLN